ncbi:S-norcoclaurine synthase 1-like, partial [Neltuma alba]|uniref:S-norcoclaurine synthase 1-like n=1 Tax=Neltuma alba TaxID=207710 RepID=UPI0010A30CFC
MEMKSESKSCKEKDEGLGCAKSLPVPRVQEIVKNDAHNVPHRYIRDQEERPVLDQLLPISSEIPVLDFSLLAKRDQHEQKKLDSACKEWGFFQIINHGVGEDLMQKMKKAGRGFFDLGMEEKQKCSMAENDIQGYGQAFVVSEDQKLDWSDIMILMTNPPQYRNLKYWPLTVIGFNVDGNGRGRSKRVAPSGKTRSAYELLSTMSQPDLVLGISPHSDSGTITILLQDDHITALRIHHHGHWIPVKPLPGAFFVNVGDTLEVWSNGRYKSVQHRAVTNESRARISIAMLVSPHDEAEMGPAEPMLRNSPA